MNYNDNIIDSRDLYKRQCELETMQSARDDAEAAHKDALEEFENGDATQEDVNAALEEFKDAADEFAEPEETELRMLQSLENEIDGYMHGTTLVNEDHFKEYAKQYADDIGAIDRNMKWPLNCIDWEQAAEELKSDFSQVEIDGTTFYFS